VRSHADGVLVNNNNFSGNTTYAVLNDDAAILNAENNWWGDNDPSDNVSANVDYDPWITGETENSEVDEVTVPDPPPIVNVDAGVTVDIAGAVGTGTVGTSVYTGTPVTAQTFSAGTGKASVKYVDVCNRSHWWNRNDQNFIYRCGVGCSKHY